MELLVKGMFYTKPKVDFDTIYILTMTDFDPAGYYIAEALEGQVKDILNAIDREYIDVEIHRIGITPDQLSYDEVHSNKYSPKKANLAKWMKRTGGIDGEEKGLELDAFSTNQIREIFVENLKEHIDISLYTKHLKGAFVKMKVLKLIQDNVAKLVDQITDEVIEDIEIMEDFDLHQHAIEGNSDVDPDDVCEDSEAVEIKMIGLIEERITWNI